MEFWRTATGNFWEGMEVSHRRYSGSMLSASWEVCSSRRSSVGSHDTHKWQFCKQTHSPFSLPDFIRFAAIGPCPCPREMKLKRPFSDVSPFSLASFMRNDIGSAPVLRTNTIGVVGLE